MSAPADRERARHGGRNSRRRLVILPASLALVAIWGIVAAFTAVERGTALERTRVQLENTVSTLVELSVLAERAAQLPARPGDPDRAAAFWHILLEHPTAWVWIEVNGTTSVGQPPPQDAGRLVVVAATSGGMTAHAALPESDALAEWRRSAWQRALALLATSGGFAVLVVRLSRALEQRAAAELEAAASERLLAQLGIYRAQLEQTVAERTAELQESNLLLKKELSERMAAEAALHQHDALLTAVTRSAASLLGTRNLDDAVLSVLEMIGRTTAVAHVHLAEIRHDSAGHLCSSVRHEWRLPGAARLTDNAAMKDIDLTFLLPDAAARLAARQIAAVYLEDLPAAHVAQFAALGVRSALLVPITVDDALWGSLDFIDSTQARRAWSWAETDTLATLAGLVGSAITRARRIKELADANTIVQNSPTILFRLRGEPSLPLIYISENIRKFGHEPASLAASPWQVALIHPDDRARVWSALTGMLAQDGSSATIEFRMRNGDGAHRWVEARCSPVRDADGRLAEIEGIIIDVTERKAAEEKITLLARTDPLTGLANRATFTERLHQAFSASRRGGPSFAVLYLDLDHFKDINDTLGHPMGDMLLRTAANRLLGGARDSDLVARLGGDEFAILQTDIADAAGAGALAEKLRQAIGLPYVFAGNTLHVTASIGVAPLSADTPDADAMLSQADLALYRAKEEGRDQYRFHSEDLDTEVRERVSLAADLRGAIGDAQLELLYQPQVDLASGTIVGVEALPRWHHPTRGLIMPSVFIPIAEKTGAILPLSRWVLDAACGQMRQWRDAGIAPPILAVNVSLIELKNGREFIDDLVGVLAKWHLAPGDLELDVTESTLAQIAWARNEVLTELQKLGVRIALDDFGTEYSSFDYLRKYRVSHVKIARSFINRATEDAGHAQTIHAIINLARELDIGVIAEGVETADQRALLVSISSSTQGQGFYFSAAVDAAQASRLLRQGMIAPTASLAAKA